MRSLWTFSVLLTLMAVSVVAGASAQGVEPGTSCVPPAADSNRPQHAPIQLTGNTATLTAALLEQQGIRSGSGTAQDPFIISGWTISSTNGVPAISIADVTLHVRIENVTMQGEGSGGLLVNRATNVVLNDIDLAGPAGLYDSRVRAMDIHFYNSTVRAMSTNIIGEGWVFGTAKDLGEYSVTMSQSDFDLEVKKVHACRDPGFFAMNLIGRSQAGIHKVDLIESGDSQISMDNGLGAELEFKIGERVDFFKLWDGSSTRFTPSEAPEKIGMPRLGRVTFVGNGATATVSSLSFGNVSLLASDEGTLRIERSAWQPRFSIPPASTLKVFCSASDIYLPNEGLIFGLELTVDDCYLEGGEHGLVDPRPETRSTPHFGRVETSEEAAGLGMAGLAAIAAVAAVVVRRARR